MNIHVLQTALDSARQFAITTPYQGSTSGLASPCKMESTVGDSCAFGAVFRRQDIPPHHHAHDQFYMTSSACADLADDRLMRRQQQMMTMVASYQHNNNDNNDVYSVLPPGGLRLRHDDAPPGERAVNFTHPFSITNIMSARQRQQQQLLEYDVKVGDFSVAGEPPAANDVTDYPYHQPMPPACVLEATYEQKSAASTPSLNGGGYDAAHYGIVSTTTTNQRKPSPSQ